MRRMKRRMRLKPGMVARLDVFLQEEELSCDAVKRDTCKASEYAVRVDSAVLSWNPEELKPFLRNVNLVMKRGEKLPSLELLA